MLKNIFINEHFVFKNDRYLFSKNSKRVGHFQKRFFSENETIFFENDRKMIVQQSFSKTINDPRHNCNLCIYI